MLSEYAPIKDKYLYLMYKHCLKCNSFLMFHVYNIQPFDGGNLNPDSGSLFLKTIPLKWALLANDLVNSSSVIQLFRPSFMKSSSQIIICLFDFLSPSPVFLSLCQSLAMFLFYVPTNNFICEWKLRLVSCYVKNWLWSLIRIAVSYSRFSCFHNNHADI